MGREADGNFAPADHEVRMMVLPLGHTRDRIHEVDGLDKVLELVGLDQFGALEAPTG